MIIVKSRSLTTGLQEAKLTLLHLYSGNVFGGISSILISLAHYAPEWPDIEQRFGLCFDARLSTELRSSAADVFNLGPARLRDRSSLVAARQRLEQSIRKNRPDIVICHDRWTICVFAPVLLRNKIPFILWLHSFRGFREDTLVTVMSQLYRPVAILTVSRATLDAAKWLYPGVNKTAIYTPLPATLALLTEQMTRRRDPCTDKRLVILNAASLRPGKGQDRLLEALSLMRHDPRWVCWLAGNVRNAAERQYLTYLRNLVQKFALSDRIIFLGERSDMWELMNQADIYCHPNVFTEGFSIALLEASLARLPIVASPYGGNAELLDSQDCGILTRPEPGLVAQALLDLLGDADRRNRLGNNARLRVSSLCEVKQQMQSIRGFLTATTARHSSLTTDARCSL